MPKTTSSRPLQRASTIPHATWNNTADHAPTGGCATDSRRQYAGQRAFGFPDKGLVDVGIQQVKGQRRLGEVSELPAEIGLVPRRCSLTDPGHEGPELNGLLERVATPLQDGLNLFSLQVDRGVVSDDVMIHQRQIARLAIALLRCIRPHQGGLLERQAKVRRIGLRPKRVQGIPGGIAVQPLYRQRGLAIHDLHRLRQARPDHRGTKAVMAVDDHLQRLQERVEPGTAVEGEDATEEVGIAFRVQLVMVEDTFLKGRKRVDVLYVRRSSGNRGDDPVDGSRASSTSGNIAGVMAVQSRGIRLAGTAGTAAAAGSLEAATIDAARLATVGWVKMVLTLMGRFWRSAACTIVTTSSECPPSSKKLSCRPMSGTPSNSLQSSANACSVGPCGASCRNDFFADQSGAGSALRSSLPLGISGSASISTKYCGTM